MDARNWSRRTGRVAGLLVALGAVPAAAAHGGTHGPPLPPWLTLVALAAGVGLVAASAAARRFISPTLALVGVFDGVLVAAVGAVGLVQFAPVESLAASQPPVGRAWYGALIFTVGLAAVVGSLVVGRMRWPDRPRYAALGMVLGLWVAYPVFAPDALTNPLGYLLALAAPATVGYVLWTDGRDLLAGVLADRPARWFGLGVGVVTALVFAFSMRLLTLVAESGGGAQENFVATTRLPRPLVYWPAVEFHAHDLLGTVPVSGVFSVGLALLVGLVAALVGLNAALLAARWRASADGPRSRAGDGWVAAPPALCLAAPVLVLLGAAAVDGAALAPLYWVFVDLASPLGALFFAASVALLTGNLVRTGRQ